MNNQSAFSLTGETRKYLRPRSAEQYIKPAGICGMLDLNGIYSTYLDRLGISYSRFPPYLLIGRLPDVKVWMLHISIVQQQINTLLFPLLNYLAGTDCPFIIPENSRLHHTILDGRSGAQLTGRVISIAVNSRMRADQIALGLIELTKDLKGPDIPESIQLGGCVYVTYGFLINSDKNPVPATGRINESPEGEKEWPFTVFSKKAVKIPMVRLPYISIQTIKKDAKGDVIRCISFKKPFSPQWCVVKKGKRYQCFDGSFRDIRDRLIWQSCVLKQLQDIVPVPRFLDLFSEPSETVLVTELISGKSLGEQLTLIYEGKTWPCLEKERQLLIFTYIRTIINIIKLLHKHQFIHRDLNPENFLVSDDSRLFLIDFELSYSKAEQLPHPPFALGTSGYMSPNQSCQGDPEYADDLYALGGILIRSFTGLSPLKFNLSENEILYRQLLYFIRDEKLCTGICNCLAESGEPAGQLEALGGLIDLSIIKATLDKTEFKHLIISNNIRHNVTFYINKTLENVFEGQPDPGKLAINPEGLIFLAAELKQSGLSLPPPADYAGWYDQIYRLQTSGCAVQGLLTPPAVALITLVRMMQSGLSSLAFPLSDCFQLPKSTDTLGLGDGLAGTGLLLLCLEDFQINPKNTLILNAVVSMITGRQQKDGSWILFRAGSTQNGIKLPGLFHGIAGIILFLIRFTERHKNDAVTATINNGLNYLIRQASAGGGVITWQLSPRLNTIDPWLEDGIAGLAYVFIRAYAWSGNEAYRDVAEAALRSNPETVSSNLTNMSNGLAGLGQVCLEAAEVFKDPGWQVRALHIAEFLSNTGVTGKNGIHYWHPDDFGEPEYSVLTGQSGILHFLLRVQNPGIIRFPLLNIGH